METSGRNRLPMSERETHISWNAAGKTATIDTVDPRVLTKLDRLHKEFPDVYRLVRMDPLYGTQWYEVDKKYIRFGKPGRPATPEQIEKLRKAREKQQKAKDG